MAKKKLDDPHLRWIEDGIDVLTNTVRLFGEVDSTLAQTCVSAFHMFDTSKPATVLLNTPGGDEYQGMAIFDTIKAHPQPVTVRVVGEACSMGAVILQAGDVRQAVPHAIIMTHAGSISQEGNKKDVKRYLKFMDRTDDRIDRIMLERIQEKHPERTLSWWKKREEMDNYMFADEAIEIGLLDEIYDPTP